MPTVDQVEDKNGNVYDIEDADARTKIGDLTELKTQTKSNLVSALNETQTPSQIETITTALGTVKFLKLGRLIKMTVSQQSAQIPENPIQVLRNIDDKYLPITDTFTTIFDADNDTPCGRALLNPTVKALDFWFAEDYQAVAGDTYVCETLYISKS